MQKYAICRSVLLFVAVPCAFWPRVCLSEAAAQDSSAATWREHFPDSTYSTNSLRLLVQAMTSDASGVPSALRAYHAHVETEIAAIVRVAGSGSGVTSTTTGATSTPERVAQLDQIASTLDWSGGDYEQHIVGYRFRSVTGSISALSYFRTPWVVPLLYGNRLQTVFGKSSIDQSSDTVAASHSAPHSRAAVHPFAKDHEDYYRSSGGDTIAVLRLANRSVPLVRIVVEPRAISHGEYLLFRGEVDVDAERHQIVRMHGQFVVQRTARSLLRRIAEFGLETVAFADLTNGEFDGQFWLPTEQRFELQLRSRLEGDSRPIIRVVSRFSDYRIEHDSGSAAVSNPSNYRSGSAQLTLASGDSLNSFSRWISELGAVTSNGRAEDFDDVAPDGWRSTGGPRFDLHSESVNEVVRFDRVEGLFIGLAGVLRFRDAAPGFEVGANVGWARSEQVARGSVWGRLVRRRTTYALRAGRELASTNDFRPFLDAGPSLSALFATVDDYDYVDRRDIRLSISRALNLPETPLVRMEFGIGDDRAEVRRVRFGLVHVDSAFRENRPVAPGGYVRSVVAVDVHPSVSGDFLEPGIGYGFWYERGDGTLRWQRLEVRVAARHVHGPLSYATHFNAVAVFTPQVLPQQIIEFGENEGLQGYAYKEFGGDRAALASAGMSYQLPFLQAPLHLGRWSGWLSRVYIPGAAPAVVVGVQSGCSEAASAQSRAALALFGTRVDSATHAVQLVTRPTSGVRSSVSITLRLFGGAFGVGVARALNPATATSRWRFTFGGGQSF